MKDPGSYHSNLPQEHLLLEALSQGSNAAFETLYKYYQPRLYLSIVPFAESSDIAEDMVQEVMFKLWARRETVLGITSLEKYLMRSTKNQLLDYRKKENREQRHRRSLSGAPGTRLVDTDTADKEMDFKEYLDVAKAAIDLLPDRQREVFLLRHKGNMTTDQIAQAIGSNPGAVRKNLARAVHFMKQHLRENSDWLGLLVLLFMDGKK
jgi:RNA polymerase sigma factor (sigma-70 family)